APGAGGPVVVGDDVDGAADVGPRGRVADGAVRHVRVREDVAADPAHVGRVDEVRVAVLAQRQDGLRAPAREIQDEGARAAAVPGAAVEVLPVAGRVVVHRVLGEAQVEAEAKDALAAGPGRGAAAVAGGHVDGVAVARRAAGTPHARLAVVGAPALD